MNGNAEVFRRHAFSAWRIDADQGMANYRSHLSRSVSGMDCVMGCLKNTQQNAEGLIFYFTVDQGVLISLNRNRFPGIACSADPTSHGSIPANSIPRQLSHPVVLRGHDCFNRQSLAQSGVESVISKIIGEIGIVRRGVKTDLRNVRR